MVNNVGKIVVFLLCFFCRSSLAVDLKLRVVDQNNIPLKEATAGYPCKVELVVQGVSGSVPAIAIPGTEPFKVFGREMQTRSVNGATSVTQRYTLRIDTPGTYILGPVAIEIDGKQYSSSTFSLRVVAGPAPAPRHVEHTDRAEEIDIFARLTLDKSRVVVGEKVTASLRVYVYGAEANVHAIIKPDCESCTMGGYKEAVSGKEMIKNKQYSFLEWTWDLRPMQAGKIAIPAYGLEYDVPKNQIQRTTHHSFLSALFNTIERKRMYSNAAVLSVSDLPTTDQVVSAVGEFSAFTAQIKPGVVEQGEGAVLTLELVGDAAFDDIQIFDLQHMPTALKWYTSKTYTQEATAEGGKAKRCFEYVVQGVEPGEVTIPAQSFFYFDTKKRSYKTIETMPISLRIKPSTAKKNTTKFVESPTGLSSIDASPLAPLYTGDVLKSVKTRQMPWWLFFLWLLASAMICARASLYAVYAYVRGFDKSDYVRKRTYMYAREAVRTAKKTNNKAKIYHIFMDLFAARAGIPVSQLTDDMILEMIKKTDTFSVSELHAWQDFFNRAAQEAYMHRGSEIADKALFEQAEQWITRLESGV